MAYRINLLDNMDKHYPSYRENLMNSFGKSDGPMILGDQ